jgi:hypothetical protein
MKALIVDGERYLLELIYNGDVEGLQENAGNNAYWLYFLLFY